MPPSAKSRGVCRDSPSLITKGSKSSICFFTEVSCLSPLQAPIFSPQFWQGCWTVCGLIRIRAGRRLDGRERQKTAFAQIPLPGNECNYGLLPSQSLREMYGLFWLRVLFLCQEAQCGYVIIVMALFWCTEALPLAVTALFPVLLFPLMNIMDSTTVRDLALCTFAYVFIGQPLLFWDYFQGDF